MNNLDLYEIDQLAWNPETEPEILDSLVDSPVDDPDYVRRLILRNPNTSLKTLNKILDSLGVVYYHLEYLFVRHPNANEDLFLKCRAKILKHKLTEWPD